MKSTVLMRVAAVMLVAASVSANLYAADAGNVVAGGKVTAGAASAAVLKPNVATTKTTATAGAVVGRAGDNQYPSGTPVVPPKPKKEGLEAAGAIKAKAAQP